MGKYPGCQEQCEQACPDKCSGCTCGSLDCSQWVCNACLDSCECYGRDTCCSPPSNASATIGNVRKEATTIAHPKGLPSRPLRVAAVKNATSLDYCPFSECPGWALKTCVTKYPGCQQKCEQVCPDKCSGCTCGSLDCSQWVCNACLDSCECYGKDTCCPRFSNASATDL